MSGITISPDSGTEFEAGSAEYNSICRLDDNNYAVAYRDNNDGNKGKVNVGSRTGTSVTISEANVVIFNNDSTDRIQIVSLSSTLVVISYRDVNTNRPYVAACSISGTTITVGTPVLVVASAPLGISVSSLDATDFVISVGLGGNLKSWVGSISGTTITLGAAQDSGQTGIYVGTIGLDGTHFVAAYSGSFNNVYLIASVVDIGAKTISWGSPTTSLGVNDLYYLIPINKFDSQHFAVAYGTAAVQLTQVRCSSIVLGTLAITLGTALANDRTNETMASLCCMTANNFLVSYYTTTGTQAEVRSGTLSGDTTLAWDAQGAVVFDNGTSAYTSLCRLTDDYFIVGHKSG